MGENNIALKWVYFISQALELTGDILLTEQIVKILW